MKHEPLLDVTGSRIEMSISINPSSFPASLPYELDAANGLMEMLSVLNAHKALSFVASLLISLDNMLDEVATVVMRISIATSPSRLVTWKAKVEADADALAADIRRILNAGRKKPAPRALPFSDGVMPCSRTGLVAALMACGVPAKGYASLHLDDLTGVAEIVFNEAKEHNAQPLLQALYKAKALHEHHYLRGPEMLTVVINCQCGEAADA